MNSTVLRIFAALLAVGALLMGWSGYRMSTRAALPAQQKVAPATFPQVVALHNIPAGKVLAADDLAVAQMLRIDPQGFDHVGTVTGKMVQTAIKQGDPILKSHFPTLSLAAQALHPGERAVAVKATEVVGVGGFLNPGDHVDVLLYLRADRETGNTSSAQVILRDARIVAYGENLGGSDAATAASTEAPSDGAKKKDVKSDKDGRSAILAVPEKDVARLMLADNAGQLRLALRGAEPPMLPASNLENIHFTPLGDLAHGGGPVLPAEAVQAIGMQPKLNKPRRPVVQEKRYTVVVHNGEQTQTVRVDD
jgi:pilus assembly protein CpaB